jgi:hypothetical protein
MSIIRTSIQETTGDSSDVVQIFYQNIFYDLPEVTTVPFTFETPIFTTNGGSRDYYGQNPRSIFTNLVKPFIRFDFTENASSFGPTTFIKHDIYRIDWGAFQSAQAKYRTEGEESSVKENIITETTEEVDEDTGEIKIKTIRKRITDSQNITNNKKEDFGKRATTKGTQSLGSRINSSGAMTQEEIQETLRTMIQNELIEPIDSVTATTTGITTNIYDLELDQFSKKLGDFKTELFQDRAQYIIDTNFIFNVDLTPGLVDAKTIDDTGAVVNVSYNPTIKMETTTERQTITEGEFAGMEFVAGDYFTYFEVPDKPIFEYPTAEGQLTTFTPEIFWGNGETADEYLVQVSYNTGDTGFTGTVFTYIVPKTDEFRQESDSKTKTSTTEFSSKKTIRSYKLSLKSNSTAIYRVGNVKFIENIFGVRQSVITFSDNKTVTTQTDPIKSYVYVEADSPYTEFIAGLSTPASLEAESPLGEYILSGTVSGSTVSGATMQLIYPNLSYATTPTDTSGYFEFSSLEAGTYTLNTSYRGYQSDSRTVVITGNTDVFVDIEINWDNIYDIWAIKENDIIKY